ncbi:MAG TPA: glycoside hydrolase family 32 protein [Terracidiphilus sp.]|jgi:beta-fructofuranosidase|nr:glycoside hydrolase family 32 protein [Terracidiphilus sp.]
MPPHNWMNDPNGPIFWKGKYHLFYQLNPNAAIWGDMHWGHAVSADMVHWHHEPVALAPTPGDPDSEGCFSGSAIVFNGRPTFIYTGVQNATPELMTLHDGNGKLRETQMLATAEDDALLHWKKRAQPIIPSPPAGMTVTGFRDPCPWHEDDGWYLGVGSGEREKGGCVLLYRSHDLLHWEYLHKLTEGKPNGLQAQNPCDSGEMWECPDFFPIDGHHCLFYSTENKVIWTTGEYDARAHLYTPKRRGVLDHGAYYAPKSFLAPDGRRILWGWIRETRPEAEFSAAGWAGAMSLPRVLGVGSEGQLTMTPAVEVETLRQAPTHPALQTGSPWRQSLDHLRWELSLTIPEGTPTISIRLRTGDQHLWELLLDCAQRTIQSGDTHFEVSDLTSPGSALRIFLDGSVVETIVGNTAALTSRVYQLHPGETELEILASGNGSVRATLWPLQPISKDRLTS